MPRCYKCGGFDFEDGKCNFCLDEDEVVEKSKSVPVTVLPRESDAKKPIITPEKKKEQGEDKQFKFDFR